MSYEFHISRQARERYQFDQALFATSGRVIFANFYAARTFAQKMNAKRNLARFPEQAVRAGQINALGLLDEIFHLVVALYREQLAPNLNDDALDWLDGMIGKEEVDTTLIAFCREFPPLAVYQRQISPEAYTAQPENRKALLEELLMLWLANVNPATAPYQELFDDSALARTTAYAKILPLLHAFFETQPPFGPDAQNLIDMLRSPAIAAPHSLSGQLEYIRTRWGDLLGKLLFRLLGGLDLIREEEKPVFGVGGPGPARIADFRGLEIEAERFSPDRDWMPSLVLIAKNAYVWLDQLSKKYQRPITTLADIPDGELDTLARWGISGLWLIGLWERSPASREIKIRRGNPEAVASAYSLYAYEIAADLGGEAAYENLRDRCWARGIRLASDMVPNHMGLDSKWVTEHPDWFISLDYPPFPSYSFNGPNYSSDPRYVIQIEDHYYDNSDAAVVFKLYDHWTQRTRYIYHGNDGTSMPWNDTAQLDYLKPEVREAVIQTILHVARKFPIIRFDAAMTLAKKHYQRLWYPEPGSGGDIPSRAGLGLTREQFDAAMPEEFWRQVVDRVAREAPDTLLLAEAFWMMEGYFVRTLGMHRVYNSAFMNMLRDEKNAEYRQVIKNTLEFDPEILKRYVNFMNNPDERTAVDQFGKGDKYFGICTLMATLPGLPMLGHGQIEGFTEKYGMEFRRAYWDETPDAWLVSRHEREIFPLLRKRYLFAEVEQFCFYDFITPDGSVNENVFAYSNRRGDERALVVYHNRFASTAGWVRQSVGYAQKLPGGEKHIRYRTLANGLGLTDDVNTFTTFRDLVTGLEYLRPNAELARQGLYVELDAYKCHVFLDFRQLTDETGQLRALCDYLNGRGVPSLDEAMKEIVLQPLHHAFRELVNAGYLRYIEQADEAALPTILEECRQKSSCLLREIQLLTHGHGDLAAITTDIQRSLQAAYELAARKTKKTTRPRGTLPSPSSPSPLHPIILAYLFTRSLGRIVSETDATGISRSWLDEWLLGKFMAQTFRELGMDDSAAWRSVGLVKLLITHGDALERGKPALDDLLADAEMQAFLGVNRYQGVLWFNQECFEELVGWLQITAQVRPHPLPAATSKRQPLPPSLKTARRWLKAAKASAFQVEKLLELA